MTYKEKYLKKLTKKIVELDKSNMVQSNYLRETRRKAEKLHGRHFVPTRFPSSEYNSLILSFNT